MAEWAKPETDGFSIREILKRRKSERGWANADTVGFSIETLLEIPGPS